MSEYDPNYIPEHAYFLLVVKIVLYDKDNNILLLQRSAQSPRPHGWDFPGGGVDKGEDPSAAVIRETLEETDIRISSPKLLTTYHGHIDASEYVALGYSALVDDTSVQLSWEHEDYQWTTIDEASHVELPQLHKTIFKAFKDELSAQKS
jgi:8-oxo-dGTP diphosphatase